MLTCQTIYGNCSLSQPMQVNTTWFKNTFEFNDLRKWKGIITVINANKVQSVEWICTWYLVHFDAFRGITSFGFEDLLRSTSVVKHSHNRNMRNILSVICSNGDRESWRNLNITIWWLYYITCITLLFSKLNILCNTIIKPKFNQWQIYVSLSHR